MMGLIELILTVCSIAHPGTCDDRHLQFVSQESLKECMSHAQPYLAQWSAEHPNVHIVKYRCAYPGKEQESL